MQAEKIRIANKIENSPRFYFSVDPEGFDCLVNSLAQANAERAIERNLLIENLRRNPAAVIEQKEVKVFAEFMADMPLAAR